MSKIVRVTRLDMWADFTVDLDKCLHFRESEHYSTEGNFYLDQLKNLWIEEVFTDNPELPLGHILSDPREPHEINFDEAVYYEIPAPSVALRLLSVAEKESETPNTFDALQLPPELEKHRELVSDIDKYRQWMDENTPPARWERRQKTQQPQRPLWNRETRTLLFRLAESKPLRGKAVNQETILDALQSAGWPDKAIPNPFRNNPALLRQTVKDLNKGIAKELYLDFTCDNHRIGWLPRTQRHISPISR